ncbi:hypothetical protein [Paraburkholderia terrae]|uniref:hypothetical protein n=1 Tax=Paraburkholderia TaxID=1822464 RepID=UPI001EE195D1|nr:hypothetical protein [Paraburkholderia terrae]BEU27748.1 hypothetical protein PBP221_78880 [Paraburkholderia sp. 22B1P]GJH03542.1 hypothetical protein CBA19C8_23315 [Paraburkholderia terrae]
MNPIDIVRLQGLAVANAEDATLWRWFSLMLQDARIRWRHAHGNWLVSIDHRHVATEATFDEAMRAAKARFDTPDNRRRIADSSMHRSTPGSIEQPTRVLSNSERSKRP